MQLKLCRISDNGFHKSGFLDQDNGGLQLHAVTQVYATLGHSLFVRMVQPDVPVVLLDISSLTPLCPM
jgi:hypothetical protein